MHPRSKVFLIALAVLTFPLGLHAEEPAAPTRPKLSREIRTEKRELPTSELQDIRLDMSGGMVSFTVKGTRYTYQHKDFAAGATFLAELRHASAVIVSVPVRSTEQVPILWGALKYDSLK
jgi:hypothetical protein